MTRTLHDKLEIYPGEPVSMTALKMTANATLRQAAELSEGGAYSPAFHAEGWKISIETPRGILGLWSSWLGNQFYLGYPGVKGSLLFSAQVDLLIKKHLGVRPARPVPQVDATAVQPHYTGEYKDFDKPLGANSLGQTIAYQERGPRRWATYWGPRVSSDAQEPGRVWIEHADFCSTTTEFRLIAPYAPEGFSTILYGHGSGRSIFTYPFTFANCYALEGPVATPVHIQPYRDRFLSLACALAQALDGACAVNVDYGFLMTPAQLEPLGYGNIRWIKGSRDNYQGWGNEIVLTDRQLAPNRTEHLLLRSGNEMVPWAAIRRIPLEGEPELTAETLLGFLTF